MDEHTKEVIAQIKRVTESARLTASKDIGDWQDDMTYIEGLATGLLAYAAAQESDATNLLRALHKGPVVIGTIGEAAPTTEGHK